MSFSVNLHLTGEMVLSITYDRHVYIVQPSKWVLIVNAQVYKTYICVCTHAHTHTHVIYAFIYIINDYSNFIFMGQKV